MLKAVEATTASSDLADIQSGEQRTQTVSVTSRIVALGEDKEPQEIEKTVKVFVRPLPFKRWLIATDILAGMLKHFPEAKIDFNDMSALGMFAAQLLGAAQVEVISLAMLATDQDEAFFDSIDLDEGLKIILAVIEVNKDFFVQKVLPMVKEAAPELQAKMQATFGQTQ